MKINLGKKKGIVWLLIFFPFITYAQETPVSLEITLDKAIEIALSESPSVKIADLEVQKKKYAKKSAQSSLYPQIDAVGQ